MKRWAIVFAAAFISFGVLAYAQSEDTITAEELGEDLKDHEGMNHVFRDRIAKIYEDMKQFPGYLKFDTANVRCRLLVGDEEDQRILGKWSRNEIDDPKGMKFNDPKLSLLWEVYFREIQPQILSISGKVTETEISGNFGYLYIFDVSDLDRVKYDREK